MPLLEPAEEVGAPPAILTREQRRSRRKREVRAVTESVKRLSKAFLREEGLRYPEDLRDERPKTRAECVDAARPCGWCSCVHHLMVDVSRATGAIKYNFPDLEIDEMSETCALDIADRGGETLEVVGGFLNLTRERVRQVEVKALRKMHAAGVNLPELVEGGPVGKRRLHVISTTDLDERLRAESEANATSETRLAVADQHAEECAEAVAELAAASSRGGDIVAPADEDPAVVETWTTDGDSEEP